MTEQLVMRFKPAVWHKPITCTMVRDVTLAQHRLRCSVCREPFMEGDIFLQQITPKGNRDVFWIHENCGEIV